MYRLIFSDFASSGFRRGFSVYITLGMSETFLLEHLDTCALTPSSPDVNGGRVSACLLGKNNSRHHQSWTTRTLYFHTYATKRIRLRTFESQRVIALGDNLSGTEHCQWDTAWLVHERKISLSPQDIYSSHEGSFRYSSDVLRMSTCMLFGDYSVA